MLSCKCEVLTHFRGPRLKQIVATWQRGAFFSRREKDTESVVGEETERRKIVAGEDKHLLKERLNTLASKTRTLTTRHPYHPTEDVEQRVEDIVKQLAAPAEASNWQDMSLTDPRLKYKILARLVQEFGKDIPNATLTQVKTVADAIEFFQTPVTETSTLDDLSKAKLPPNLHIQTEALRFQPETDDFFGGRTAYVGRDTVVTSLKYKRKYKGSAGKEEKPGYVNHYFGY